jgi:hypothetical protein
LTKVCSPTRKAGKNEETGFMWWSPACPFGKQWVIKDKISIYLVKVNFSKIVFKERSENFYIWCGSY